MLRILHTLPDLHTGGGQMVLLRHLSLMDPGRFEHHICSLSHEGDMRSLFEAVGVQVHVLPHRGWLHARGVVGSLTRLLHELGIALVHTNGTTTDKLYGQIAALRADLPVVNTLHGVKPRPRRPRPVLRHLSRSSLEIPLDRLTRLYEVAVSQPILEDWQERLRFGGVRPDHQQVIYSGIPVEEYRLRLGGAERQQLRGELGLEPGDFALMTVTRLVPAKGLETLVPMMQGITAEQPASKLLIVGDGDERARLENEVRAAGLEGRVQLLGRRSDVARLLAAADLFVFPSLFEGFGLVVLEAMAAGLPVVSFDLPALRVLEEQQTGIALVKERSGESLANRIIELARDRAALARTGARAAEIVAEGWNAESSAESYARLYDRVVAAER